jgi:hypothetical protein
MRFIAIAAVANIAADVVAREEKEVRPVGEGGIPHQEPNAVRVRGGAPDPLLNERGLP